MRVDRKWVERNLGFDPIATPPPDATFASVRAAKAETPEDFQREIIDFDSEGPEGRAFLAWLLNHHFTFLGSRDYALEKRDGEDVLRIVPGSSLGIMRERHGKEIAERFAALPPQVRAYARRPGRAIVRPP